MLQFALEGIPSESPFKYASSLNPSFVNDKNGDLSEGPFPVCEESASQNEGNRTKVCPHLSFNTYLHHMLMHIMALTN